MKALKIIAILLVVYVGIVVDLESLLGFYQPAGRGTMVITTTHDNGVNNDRVLARLQAEHGHGMMFRILTGFSPRYFVGWIRGSAHRVC